jgi:hypothetical protein
MSPILKLRSLPLAVLIYQSFSSQPLIRGFGPSGCAHPSDGPRDLRCAPIPGYLLKSLRDNSWHQFVKPQNPLALGKSRFRDNYVPKAHAEKTATQPTSFQTQMNSYFSSSAVMARRLISNEEAMSSQRSGAELAAGEDNQPSIERKP